METVREKVLRTIRRFNLLEQGDAVLVAVSGGPDSRMLLHLLQALAPVFELRLGVAHVHHGVRPGAADQEALDVENLSRSCGLPFHLHHAGLDLEAGSFEERARQARYAFFDQVARKHGYTKIALGHQADDNAEVVLMNLMRGSGRRGLAGIPPCRDGRIIRPLLQLRRYEIQACLAREGLDYATDLSNLDRRFERNRVRHDLIPLLQRFCSHDIVTTLNRTSALFREEEEWFEAYLHPVLEKAVLAADNRRLVLDAALLRIQHPALQRRLLRLALRRWIGHLHRISADHIETLRTMLAPGTRPTAASLPGNITADRADDTLAFQTGNAGRRSSLRRQPPPQVRRVDRINQDMVLDLAPWDICLHLELRKNTGAPWLTDDSKEVLFDADQLRLPLIIRSFRAGDRVEPFGLGGSKKLSDLFIDLKVPRKRRATVPLLFGGDALLWVVGIRRSAHAPVTDSTTRILRVTCTARPSGGKPLQP